MVGLIWVQTVFKDYQKMTNITSRQRIKGDITQVLWFNPKMATYNLQQTTISNFAAFSKITNKEWYLMRIVCWQKILMKYHTLFFFENWERCWKICRLLQSWLALWGLIVIFLAGDTKSKCCKLWTCCNSVEYQCQHNPQSLSENTCEYFLHTVAGPQVRVLNWKSFFYFPNKTYVVGT